MGGEDRRVRRTRSIDRNSSASAREWDPPSLVDAYGWGGQPGSGRGSKGSKARNQIPAGFEGGQMPLHMRLPKLRGFTNPNEVVYQVVNVASLAKLFPEGGPISIADLVAKGAVRKGQPVKVLGNGDITVSVNVTVDAFSKSAESKITAAGGTIAAG